VTVRAPSYSAAIVATMPQQVDSAEAAVRAAGKAAGGEHNVIAAYASVTETIDGDVAAAPADVGEPTVSLCHDVLGRLNP